MRLITYEIPSEINYGVGHNEHRNFYDYAYGSMLRIFEKNRSSGRTFCYLPKYWAFIVSNMFERMLNVDSGLKFYRVFEKYGKINIEILPSNDSEETLLELSDLKHEAQNRIDNIMHRMAYKKIYNNKAKLEKGETEWLLSKGTLNIVH